MGHPVVHFEIIGTDAAKRRNQLADAAASVPRHRTQGDSAPVGAVARDAAFTHPNLIQADRG
jgi:hypothetical protein